MLPLSPRRIEMMPGQIRAAASLDGTAEAHLFCKLTTNRSRWLSTHPEPG
jgi:hypothetical protein